jgi:hypothetical protein
MALRPFNSVAGITVGENPETTVILANGDITTTNLTANGVSNLGNIGNVKIFGGTSGQTIVTDGNGNLTFSATSSNSAAPMPYYIPNGESYSIPNNFQGLFAQPIDIEGALEIDGVLIEVSVGFNAYDNQVLFAENGDPTGNVGFTFNTLSGNLDIPGNVSIAGNILPPISNTYSIGSSSNRWSNLWLSGNTIYLGNGIITETANGTLSLINSTGAQLDVTGNSVSSDLSVTGNVVAGNLISNGNSILGNLSVTGTLNAGDISVSSIANGTSNVDIVGTSGNVTTSVSGNANIFVVTGTGANVNGYLSVSGNVSTLGIKTDNYYYANGQPLDMQQAAGSNSQIQFNNNNDFGASANFTFDSNTNLLTVTGNIAASNANLGNVVSANYLVSNSGCVSIGSGLIAVSGNAAGIFASSITDINLGLASNITMGSQTGNIVARNNFSAETVSANNVVAGDFYSKRQGILVTTDTLIDSFGVSEYRSAKYTIKVGDDTGYQALEVLLVHNNINSIITVYGSLSMTGLDLVTLTTNINGSNVELRASGLNANTSVNLMGTYVPD